MDTAGPNNKVLAGMKDSNNKDWEPEINYI
jgi:hypothetical protein